MFSSLCHGQSSLVPLGAPGPLRLSKARFWHFDVQGALLLILLGDVANRFGIRGAHSMVPLRSGADLAVEGSLGNWTRFISPGIPFLSFVRGKFPPDFVSYIRRPRKIILLCLQTPESYGDSRFSHFHEPRMPLDLLASQLRQRKQRPKIFLSFNRGRKRTLLLRPGTVAGANYVRSMTSLQTLIKNVQELAKKEREESEAKLREAIEILEGDHLRHYRWLTRLPGGDFLEVQILASV